MSALGQGLNSTYLDRAVQPQSARNTSGGLTVWPDTDFLRKPPARQTAPIDIDRARLLLEESRARVGTEIEQLKLSYVFPPGDTVDLFLKSHPALSSVLHNAINPLKEAFGEKTIFALKLSTDDDDATMLYGIAIWHESVRSAVQALDRFEENWWLDHMTAATTDLAFVYKIV